MSIRNVDLPTPWKELELKYNPKVKEIVCEKENLNRNSPDSDELLSGSHLVDGLLNTLVMFLYLSLEPDQHGI